MIEDGLRKPITNQLKIFRERIYKSDRTLNAKMHELEKLERAKAKLFGTDKVYAYEVTIQGVNKKNESK